MVEQVQTQKIKYKNQGESKKINIHSIQERSDVIENRFDIDFF
jgi:hypothetical protein